MKHQKIMLIALAVLLAAAAFWFFGGKAYRQRQVCDRNALFIYETQNTSRNQTYRAAAAKTVFLNCLQDHDIWRPGTNWYPY